MYSLRSLPSLAFLFAAVVGLGGAQETYTSRTSPPDGAVVVDASGENGDFATVQEGVDALSLTDAAEQSLFIYPGVYEEQVYIAPRAANLAIYGYTTDTTSYTANEVNITNSLSRQTLPNNDLTATVRASTPNLKMYNVNILNTFGSAPSNGQALALSATQGNQGYYGIGLYGYQDTLLANQGRQVYAHGTIVGATDFIFGQRGQVWLESIDIVTIAVGWITASGRNDTENLSWYVIDSSTVTAVEGTYLGRPWGEYARVVFQNTYLNEGVEAAGWSVWNASPQERTCCVTFAEFNNTGPGSETGARAEFSQQLEGPVERETVLGDGYEGEWFVDVSYLN